MGLFIKKPLEACRPKPIKQEVIIKTGIRPLESGRTRRRSHYRSRTFLHNRNSRRRIYRTGHYTFICHCSNRMLLCRTLLCRVCFDDPGCRKCLYILIRDDGRTDRLDYRLGSGTGIYSCRDNGQHQLEPLSRRLFGRARDQPSDSIHCLSLGWRDCQYPSIPDRCPDEPLSDPRDGRELYL